MIPERHHVICVHIFWHIGSALAVAQALAFFESTTRLEQPALINMLHQLLVVLLVAFAEQLHDEVDAKFNHVVSIVTVFESSLLLHAVQDPDGELF